MLKIQRQTYRATPRGAAPACEKLHKLISAADRCRRSLTRSAPPATVDLSRDRRATEPANRANGETMHRNVERHEYILTVAAPRTTGAADPAVTIPRALAAACGGCTVTDGHGAWRDDSGETVREPVAVVTASTDSRGALTTAVEHTVALLYLARQDAAWLTINGRAYLVTLTAYALAQSAHDVVRDAIGGRP